MAATIQPKHDLDSEPVGDVVVTYADGTTDLWTLKGNCKLPKVSPRGELGWVACETEPNGKTLKLHEGVAIGNRLTICFKGRVIANLRAGKPFIEDWAFQADGLHVVLKSRAAHGLAIVELFALHDGPPEAAVSAYRSGLPGWAQPFRD